LAHVQFLQFILAGLIAATLVSGGMAIAMSVRALESDGMQYAAYQSVEQEALR
jgi:hypothetical protein